MNEAIISEDEVYRRLDVKNRYSEQVSIFRGRNRKYLTLQFCYEQDHRMCMF